MVNFHTEFAKYSGRLQMRHFRTFNTTKTMNKTTCTLYLFIITMTGFAQIEGTMFPEMIAETVDDKKITLPADVKGKFTLLGLAYSKKSEDELNTWFEPIISKFIQKPQGLLAGMGYDVNVFFVPMFTGINAAAAGTAKRKALKNLDPQLLPYILFYKGDLKPYKEALDFQKRDIPYFFVLNAEGKIVYATSGAFSESKMDAIEDVIE